MKSVERPTLIELFSTFFDRVTSNHPQRNTMIKELYQFKSHLYTNDTFTIQNFLDNLSSQQQPKQVEEKSPLRDGKINRENSAQRSGNYQNRLNSQKKDYVFDKENIKKLDPNNQSIRQLEENLDLVKNRLQNQQELLLGTTNSKYPISRLTKNNTISNSSNILFGPKQDNDETPSTLIQSLSGTSRITRINSKRNNIITSCNHEIDRETFSQYVNSRANQLKCVDCPVCATELPMEDYGTLIQMNFDEFKLKHYQFIKVIESISKNDYNLIHLVKSLNQEDNFTTTKQRQISLGTDIINNLQYKEQTTPLTSNNGNSRIVSQEFEYNQRFKKCLRCSKTVEGGSYFCSACKNV